MIDITRGIPEGFPEKPRRHLPVATTAVWKLRLKGWTADGRAVRVDRTVIVSLDTFPKAYVGYTFIPQELRAMELERLYDQLARFETEENVQVVRMTKEWVYAGSDALSHEEEAARRASPSSATPPPASGGWTEGGPR